MWGKRVFIDFDGAMLASTVYLNETRLGLHQGGYTPFSFELTQHLRPGENVLTVYVDSTENEQVPPYGRLVDFLTFGGIYRDVFLRAVEPGYMVHVFARPTNVLTRPGLECDIQLSQCVPGLEIDAVLQDAAGQVIARARQPVGAEHVTVVFPDVGPVALWSLDDPALYTLVLTLSRDGVPIDQESVRVVPQRRVGSDGKSGSTASAQALWFNATQTYPYLGAAAPARLQRLDADILKHELGCNLVRTAHYAHSPHFLDRCDEIGLLVFEELAGWQHIGDEVWQARVLQDLRSMLMRDRNHPSIILWGVRINESPDHDALYTQTNRLARELDPTRSTGGVRNFVASSFLEDVFTAQRLHRGIIEPWAQPHLITEFGGHMFPTKPWDHEERRIEHAADPRPQARSGKWAIPRVAARFGWCAFDYHTHQEFGSGDRVLLSRCDGSLPPAEAGRLLLRSQKSPRRRDRSVRSTHWTMGDRSGGQ